MANSGNFAQNGLGEPPRSNPANGDTNQWQPDTGPSEMSIPIPSMKVEDKPLGTDAIKKVAQELDNHDWIQRGLCIARPFTALIHFIFACPCYLVTSLFVFLTIALRSIILCMGLSSCIVKPPAEEPDGEKVPRIFFDGAGWAFPFSLGVSKHIREEYDMSKCKIYGISAGNIAGICLLLDKDPSTEIMNFYGGLREDALYSHFQQPLCAYCSTLQPVRAVLNQLVPDNIHTIATGRYHAMVTPWPHLGIRFLSEYHSKAEFVDAVLCSMALPMFVYRPLISRYPGWRGLWVDGGLQTLMTPIDHLADVSVRTFADPLHRFRETSLHPPPAYGIKPLDPLLPVSMQRVLEKIEVARTFAAEHAGLRQALLPYAKHRPPAPLLVGDAGLEAGAAAAAEAVAAAAAGPTAGGQPAPIQVATV